MSAFLLLFLAVTSAHGTTPAEDCAARFAELEIFLPTTVRALQTVTGIDTQILAGQRTPRWQDFESLRLAMEMLPAEAGGDHTGVYGPMPLLLDHDYFTPALTGARNAFAGLVASAPHSDAPLGPTEYDLRRAFRQRLQRFIARMPPELRATLPPIPTDGRMPEVRRVAENLLAGLRGRFDRNFERLYHRDYETYLRDLRAALGANDDAVRELDAEDVEVVIARPQSGRFWIPTTGFQNQFVTKSSRGSYDNSRRRNVESAGLGIPLVDYEGTDPESRPQYGALRRRLSATRDGSIATHYGEDRYIMRLDRIRDRLTMTPGDSFYNNATRTYSFWDTMFLPWERRMLAAEYLRGLGNDQFRPRPPSAATPGVPSSDAFSHGNYVEMQIWGPVRLSDVAAFEFTSTPPSGDFLRELQRQNIEIYDARSHPRVRWTPTATTPPP